MTKGLTQDAKAMREKYIENRLMGMVPTQAARNAGYADPASSAKDLERNPDIQEIIAAEIKNNRKKAMWTRGKVLDVISDAVEMARLQADPATMIKGAQEINKMEGHLAPEKRQVEISHEHEHRIHQLQELPESEILERLGKDPAYIDAEFEEVSPENE